MTVAPGQRSLLEAIGAKALSSARYVGGATLMFLSAARCAVRGLVSRKVRFGRKALTEQTIRVGVHSLGIVIVVQGFIGVILALQMTPPLEPWGQTDKVANIIGVAGFRMLGPMLTAIVLSGFAGASIAAELGTMVVSEEIEAMEVMALNPIRFLVVPRVLATILAMLLLTVVGDLMIAIGGWIASRVVLGPDAYEGYWRRMRVQLEYRDFFTGLIQAGVFGILISAIACYEGLRVRGGAAGVGRATTMTVVYSIVSIIVAACVFTAIFYTFGL